MIEISGMVETVGGADDTDASVELRLDSGKTVRVHGIALADCRKLGAMLFQRVTLRIEAGPVKPGDNDPPPII